MAGGAQVRPTPSFRGHSAGRIVRWPSFSSRSSSIPPPRRRRAGGRPHRRRPDRADRRSVPVRRRPARRPVWLLLGADGRLSLTYDRVVRVVELGVHPRPSARSSRPAGLWPETQTAIFVLLAHRPASFLLVVHEVIPRRVLGPARPIVEGSVGITLATLLVVLTGGPSSPFFFAYALIVVGAALVLPPAADDPGDRPSRVGGYLVGVLADPADAAAARRPSRSASRSTSPRSSCSPTWRWSSPASSADRATRRSGCRRSTR